MDADAEKALNDLTSSIIGCAFHVSNTLGCGMYEKVYENAMVVALQKASLLAEQQKRYKVVYEGIVVGEYIADLVIENQVLLELKSIRDFDENHSAQCLNLLIVTQLPACLLMNFGKSRVEIKRFRCPER